jgi:hypothetical protein
VCVMVPYSYGQSAFLAGSRLTGRLLAHTGQGSGFGCQPPPTWVKYCKGPQNTNTKHNHTSERMDPLRQLAGSLRMCLINKYSGPAVSLMMCCTLLSACTGLVIGGLHVCRAGVFPKVSRTLTTSGNPLHQGVAVSSSALSHASSGWRETKSADTGVVVGAHGKACGRCERVGYKLMLPSGSGTLRFVTWQLPCDCDVGLVVHLPSGYIAKINPP